MANGPPCIDDLRTGDVVRHATRRMPWYRGGRVLVMLPGEPERVIVRWKARQRVELVRDLRVTGRAK